MISNKIIIYKRLSKCLLKRGIDIVRHGGFKMVKPLIETLNVLLDAREFVLDLSQILKYPSVSSIHPTKFGLKILQPVVRLSSMAPTSSW